MEAALDGVPLVGRNEGVKDGGLVDSTFDGELDLVLDGEVDFDLLDASDSTLVGILDSSCEDGDAD